jgi:DNA polymerase-3 subunit delta'
MNLNSANALLKTLEEPSASSLLILITEFPSRLPATVLSRCQRLRCPPPDPQTAGAWLARHRPEVTNPALLLALTGGSPLAAAELGDGDALTRRDAMLGELTALLRGRADPVDIAAEWLKFGARESLYWLYHWLADIRRIQAGRIPPHLAGAQEGQVRQLGEGVSADALHRMLQLTERALRLVEGQSNAQLLLEDVLIAWTMTGSAGGGRAAAR